MDIAPVSSPLLVGVPTMPPNDDEDGKELRPHHEPSSTKPLGRRERVR